MKRELVFAGFGGQGVLTIGLFMAYAGMIEGKKVLYVPSYGPEMRGGTANCAVTISTQEISSPVITNPEIVVVMNQPSFDRFEPVIKPGGSLLVNGSMVHREPKRQDINSWVVPAQEISDKIDASRSPNLVMLGVLLQALPLIDNERIEEYLTKTFGGKYMDRLPSNLAAINAGREYFKDNGLQKATA